MRVLLAQAGGKWLQRVDGHRAKGDDVVVLDDAQRAAFACSVAAQFGVDPMLVTVEEREVPDDAAYQRLVTGLAGGTMEGVAVTAAASLSAPPDPYAVLTEQLKKARTVKDLKLVLQGVLDAP